MGAGEIWEFFVGVLSIRFRSISWVAEYQPDGFFSARPSPERSMPSLGLQLRSSRAWVPEEASSPSSTRSTEYAEQHYHTQERVISRMISAQNQRRVP